VIIPIRLGLGKPVGADDQRAEADNQHWGSYTGVGRRFTSGTRQTGPRRGEIIYECPNGLLWNHQTYVLADHGQEGLSCNLHGLAASARIGYGGTSFLRGGPKHYGGGKVEDLYKEGAVRNIATFYQSIVEGQFDNPTVRRAVDGTLTAILGREAAFRGARMTMEELLKENRKIEVDLSGLEA